MHYRGTAFDGGTYDGKTSDGNTSDGKIASWHLIHRRCQALVVRPVLGWFCVCMTLACASQSALAASHLAALSKTAISTTFNAQSPTIAPNSAHLTQTAPIAELLLIGGGMSTCSSMAPQHCQTARAPYAASLPTPRLTLANVRQQSLIALDPARIARATAPEYWPSERQFMRHQLQAQLQQLQLLAQSSALAPQSVTERANSAVVESTILPRAAPVIALAQFEQRFRQLPALPAHVTDTTPSANTATTGERSGLTGKDVDKIQTVQMLSGDAIWQQLHSDEFDRMLDALEYIPSAAGTRSQEQVWLSASTDPHSLAIYQHIIRAGLARPRHNSVNHAVNQLAHDQQQPLRIVFLTVASRDPFAAVDFYQQVFTQAALQQGLPAQMIEVRWLPLSAAVMQLQHDKRQCDQLALVLAAFQGSFFRQHAYPDLFAQMQQFCRAAVAQAVADIEAADVIFFNGGDQQLSKMAFYQPTAQGGWQPSPILTALQQRYWQGELLVVGTSAGTAVQSGALASHLPFFVAPHATLAALKPPMIRGGDSEQALWQRSLDLSPRSVDESPSLFSKAQQLWHAEDAYLHLRRWREQHWHTQQALQQLSYDHSGGLGLFPWGMLDTHFSERGRELRLIRMLHDRQTALGFGIDEATALQVQSHINPSEDSAVAARIDMQVLGAGGVFIADLQQTPHDLQSLAARKNMPPQDMQLRNIQLHYLPSGAVFRLEVFNLEVFNLEVSRLNLSPLTSTSASYHFSFHPLVKPTFNPRWLNFTMPNMTWPNLSIPIASSSADPMIAKTNATPLLSADGFRQFAQHWCQQAVPATPWQLSTRVTAASSLPHLLQLHLSRFAPIPLLSNDSTKRLIRDELPMLPLPSSMLSSMPASIPAALPQLSNQPKCQYQHAWLTLKLTPI